MNSKKQKTLSLDELLEMENINLSDPFGDVDIQNDENKTKRLNKEEIAKVRKDNKYYLPILSLNDPNMWAEKPKKNRIHFTDEVAKETCLTNCCGVPGVFSACCRLDLDDLEHVLGPVTEKWVKRFLNYAKKRGWNYRRSDVVIDIEEGKLIGERFFNGHPVFSRPSSYPMMRLQIMGPRLACKFLNPEDGLCGIYQNRPDMCKKYICQYVKNNYLVRLPDKPNTYRKITSKKEKI